MADTLIENSGQGAPIGVIETADGPVFALRADGTRIELKPGDTVLQGDELITGDGASVSITFSDHSTFSLGEGGHMVLDEFVYSPATESGASVISVTEGVFVFVSGAIAKTAPDAMMVKTPVLSIGVRGTKVAGQAGDEGSENTITLLEEDGGFVGEIALITDGGTQVLNQALQTVSISSYTQAPPPPVKITASQVKALYGKSVDLRIDSPEPEDHSPAEVESLEETGIPVDEELEIETAEGPIPGEPRNVHPPMQPFHHRPPVEEPMLDPALRPVFESVFARIGESAHDPEAVLEMLAWMAGEYGDPMEILKHLMEEARAAKEEEQRKQEEDHASETNYVQGDPGNDTIEGTPWADILDGGPGDDHLMGRESDDVLLGGPGNDRIFGDDGNDALKGGDGYDVLVGGSGNDQMDGGNQTDKLYGEDGNDELFGGEDHDWLDGGTGNDELRGADGDDYLFGGSGNDILHGGSGADILEGGAGEDVFLFLSPDDGLHIPDNSPLANMDGIDLIRDFGSGADTLAFLADAFGLGGENNVEPVFTVIGERFDGTNAYDENTGHAEPTFILDKTGTLYYDDNGAEEGYTAVARTEPGTDISAADITLV